MILTKTVVAGAFGAVTKFKLWKVRVRAPADGTLVPIALLGFLFLLLPSGGFKLDGLMGVLMPHPLALPAKGAGKIAPEKDKEV